MGDADETVHHCFCYYPAVGQVVTVMSEESSSSFDAVVTAAPAEELGMWTVRPLRSGNKQQCEQQRVHFSRLASRCTVSTNQSTKARAPKPTANERSTHTSVAARTSTGPVKSYDQRPLIAIVGAGLGGLAAAAAMQRWGARVQVYEQDCSFDQRKQGYGLTMQQGGAALRALGAENLGHSCVSATLHASFASDGKILGRYGHDARSSSSSSCTTTTVTDSVPNTKRRKKSKRGRNFLIPRQRLRQELLDLLEPNTVQWGHKFESYNHLAAVENEDGVEWAKEDRITARFSKVETPPSQLPGDPGGRTLSAERISNVEVHAAILVGADGIFSRIAKQRLDASQTKLVYTGVLVVLGIVDYAEDRPADGQQRLQDHELLKNGTTIAETVDGTTRFYMMPFSDTKQMWQLSVPMPLDRARSLQQAGPSALHRESLQLCGDWHEPLPKLIGSTMPENVTGYPALYVALKSCAGQVFDRDPLPQHALQPHEQGDARVALLGDAMHPMAPFKGQGANQALLDGILLSDELRRSEIGRNTAYALSGQHYASCGSDTGTVVRSVAEAMESYHTAALARSAVKVQLSRAATALLHSEAALTPGDLTRAGTARTANGDCIRTEKDKV